jgi:putative endonuclease
MGNDYMTIYIGVTSDLVKRVCEHKNKYIEGFTERYDLTKLLYYEVFENVNNAVAREKQLKR